MGRRSKAWTELGLLPLRQHWQQINREERQAQAELRAKRKVDGKKRAKCQCKAYPWPHRPGGGLCRYPDPPVECYRRPDWTHRPYRRRYAGILRQIARNNGLHPIRDRGLIQELLPRLIGLAKHLKRQSRKWQYKYRNMEIIDNGNGSYTVRGIWTTAGPTM